MSNFVDEYPRSLDDKGRFILPSKLREKLKGTIYITRSPSAKDACLYIYPEEEWEKISEKLGKLPTATDPASAAFVRKFFAKATSYEPDKQGRVAISQRLMEFAGLSRDIVLVGANTRLEIWDARRWDDYQDDMSDDIISEGILKYGINI
ncbi:MAG: division/cell wall cluster transcriptional repressor MraZ [Oscillospiraceae bacterium]|nr:division/cell wall cluster transcriptional repressor MraZ [Oscillospiraceae bacterium]